jgi:hypothetical protein
MQSHSQNSQIDARTLSDQDLDTQQLAAPECAALRGP